MPAIVTRAACAFALAVPLLIAVGPQASAHDYPAENDCNEPYGAITDQPAPNRKCVGLDFKDGDFDGNDHHNHHNGGFGGGEWYGPGPGG